MLNLISNLFHEFHQNLLYICEKKVIHKIELRNKIRNLLINHIFLELFLNDNISSFFFWNHVSKLTISFVYHRGDDPYLTNITRRYMFLYNIIWS